MSYEIIYDKLFIKANKDNKEVFFPILLAGSNNCTEFYNGRERRARDWGNANYMLGFNEKQYGTKEEILSGLEKWRNDYVERYKDSEDDKYNDANFGYFTGVAVTGKSCSGTSYKTIKNIFWSGMLRAFTVEELNTEGISVRVHTSYHAKDRLKQLGLDIVDEYPKSSEELLRVVEEKAELLKDAQLALYVSFPSISDYIMKRIKLRYKKAPSQKKPVTEYYVVKFASGTYFKQLTSRRMFSAWNAPFAKPFKTEKLAKTLIEKLRTRLLDKSTLDGIEVEKITLDTPIYI